jgi:hypothetical protein
MRLELPLYLLLSLDMDMGQLVMGKRVLPLYFKG